MLKKIIKYIVKVTADGTHKGSFTYLLIVPDWTSRTGSFSDNVGKERQSHCAVDRRKLVGCSYFVKGCVTSSFPSSGGWLFCPTEVQAGAR